MVLLNDNKQQYYFLQLTGTVKWRRYPCFCPNCFLQRWDDCTAKAMVGEMKTVKIS